MSAYVRLEERFRRMLMLRSVEDVLHWDTAAVMPKGAAESRSDQLALLRVMGHEMLADQEMDDLLSAAESQADALSPWQAANLREMRRQWVHAASVPADLVAALSKASSACERRWRDARPQSDFEGIAPMLSEVLDLVRQAAQARAERLGCDAYDALLDEHEPGMLAADIDPLFEPVAAQLPSLLDDVLAAQSKQPPVLPLEGPFPVETQRTLGLTLMRALGFDEDHGRLDVSLHPFCGGTADDVRITTRYEPSNFAQSLMGVIHETGHALYQRGLPSEWRHQPVGEARGMAMHESQSLLVEMQVCRSRPFFDFAAPLIRKAFGKSGPAWEAENLYRRATRVERSLIRVDADEVTYPAHIILRYRLERALIGGDLQVADLPGAWADGMRELLDLEVPDHRHGCLQDIHWFDGAFGYFPSYTLGAMIAAQLFGSARRSHPETEAGIARGDFAPLIAWLRENVHSHGSLSDSKQLVEDATGEVLGPTPYLNHLRTRYLG